MEELVEQYAQDAGRREGETRRAVRARSEGSDIAAVTPETGAVLEFFARLIQARHVVEVGTGGGYSGLWLLAGMDPKGSLSTIESDPQRHGLAQRAFADGRVGDRVRAMLGPALTVLPRLADGNYDLAYLDGDRAEYPDYLQHATRLLRVGGLLLARLGATSGREEPAEEVGLRAFGEAVADDAALLPVALPVGAGLVAAVRLAHPA